MKKTCLIFTTMHLKFEAILKLAYTALALENQHFLLSALIHATKKDSVKNSL